MSVSVSSATTAGAVAADSHRHIPVLDGLRGLAILLVMQFHFSRELPTDPVHKLLSHLFTLGWAGVDLFFVLSGFLITGILLDARGSKRYFRAFYSRRVLRIFPLYYLAVALRYWVAPAIWPTDAHLFWTARQATWAFTYLNNVAAVVPGASDGIISHFWSLAVEEQFYFVWPFVVLMLSRRNLKRATVAIIIGACVVRVAFMLSGLDIDYAYKLTPARIDALAMGAWLAIAAREPGGLVRLTGAARRVFALCGGAILIAALASHESLRFELRWVEMFAVTPIDLTMAALLLLAIVARPHTWIARLFGARGMRSFGRYSYALYVVHWPVFLILSEDLPASALPTIAGSRLPAQLAFEAVAFALSFALAVASWYFFERHFLQLKRYFAYDEVVTAAPSDTVQPVPAA